MTQSALGWTRVPWLQHYCCFAGHGTSSMKMSQYALGLAFTVPFLMIWIFIVLTPVGR
jgi:hypothetical protein